MPPIVANNDFSSLFEFLPIGAYRSSPGGLPLRANPALVALNGYCSEAEHLASTVDIATEWYVDPMRRAEFLGCLARDGFVTGFVSEVYRRKTGERIWVSENAHAVRAADGELRFYEGTVEDITARVAAQAALRESEARWKLALDSSGDGVWDWDLVSGAETYSRRFKELYGYTENELDERHEAFDNLTHPEDMAQMLRDRQAHFDGHAPRYVNEHRVRCKDGSWKWVLSRGMVIRRDAQGRPLRMIGTHTDITARREAEALRAARDRAEAADRTKSEMMSRVSHELRTPLNAVLGFAQLLDTAPDISPRYHGWVQHILASGRHLLNLVDDVLDVSSAQNGAISLSWAEVDPVAVLLESWTMLSAQAAQAGVRLDATTATANLPECCVRADRRRLTQVMNNLLSNAIKYNRDGGLVAVQVARVGEQVQIRVSDDGKGLDAGQLARMFTPFERLGAEHSTVQGTGLGLVLARQLVQAMNGELSVTSVPGRGSTFTVTLRAADPA